MILKKSNVLLKSGSIDNCMTLNDTASTNVLESYTNSINSHTAYVNTEAYANSRLSDRTLSFTITSLITTATTMSVSLVSYKFLPNNRFIAVLNLNGTAATAYVAGIQFRVNDSNVYVSHSSVASMNSNFTSACTIIDNTLYAGVGNGSQNVSFLCSYF